MVIYELIKETEEKLDYSYYPEGNKDKKAGLITIDRINEKIDLTEVAEGDYEIVVLAEDLLRMDQSFIDCCRRLRLSVFLMPILSFFNDFSLQYCTKLLTPNLSIEVAPIVHC